MGRENYVDVELIANPAVKRVMNVNSFKLNQKKWRLQNGQTLEAALQVKKKDVEPVVSKIAQPTPELPKGGISHEIKVDKSDFEETNLPDEFAPPVETETTDIETLRAQYQEKFGKAPDGRWNVARLTKEING